MRRPLHNNQNSVLFFSNLKLMLNICFHAPSNNLRLIIHEDNHNHVADNFAKQDARKLCDF